MILKTTGLCKNFKGQMAVNNVSLNIRRNSVYGLLGPNGAGKSTTLKMITGILRPTSGSIEFDGHPWQRSDLTQIGALIETPPLYENLTAYENLKVRTIMLRLPDTRIDEVLHIVRLTDTGKKRAGQFSLGMKQRLGIAIALLNSPQLLILDEPTNGLDPVGIEELRELIRSFPAKGITVILSSHILSEVQQIADHVGIIAGGVLGYENELRTGENLEQLFMDVVKRHHKAVVIASIWQIPICLLLTRKTGLLFPIAANTLLGIFMPILLGNTALSWVCPYCWAAKTAELIMGIESNGTFSGVAAFSWVVLLPLVFSVILYALLTLWDAEHFSEKEGK